MESGYRAQRKRNMFSVAEIKPFKLSRSRIENFIQCRRCFYLDRKCGTDQPPMFPYTLNNAVDALLKKEFDQYRLESKSHPIFAEHGIDAIPFTHANLNDWRTDSRGIQYYHEQSNFLVHGAIDDVWVNPQGELIIVDYKATSVAGEVSLENRDSYKRQMEIYQWLFRCNGFSVSNTGYFFYCNADTSVKGFNGILSFDISILPYEGNASWVVGVLNEIKACLVSNNLPELSPTCNYCTYWHAVKYHTKANKDLI